MIRAAIYLVNTLVKKKDFRLIAAELKCAVTVNKTDKNDVVMYFCFFITII